MVSDTKKNLNNTIYGRANLPSRLEMSTNTTTYIYDANDMRIYKKVDSLGTIFKEEYYLRDATGRELAVIDNHYNINWYIYGKERVASMQHEMPVGLEKLFITGNIPGGKHYAAESLKTDGTVQSDATLEAGDRVSMLPGFNASADAEFKADIKKPDGIPNFIYYLYDHLGNTRVTYHVDLYVDVGVDEVQVKRTVESASDYYPYGKALRSFGKERYQSTYHERDVESGFDYRGARFTDSDIARFSSFDPLAGDIMQVDKSPYAYVWSNPVKYTDPDGECPWCLGAAIGAAIDYGTQVAGNLAEGKSLGDALVDVDGKSILVSATSGALGGGLISNVAKAVKGAKKANDIQNRAKVIQNVQKHQIARNKSTTAVAKVTNPDGSKTKLVASSRNRLTPAQRNALKKGEQEVKGKGHAERTILNHAKSNGQKVNEIAASRPICNDCAEAIIKTGAKIKSPLKNP